MPGAGLPGRVFREAPELAAPRTLLTRRVITWAADGLADDDTAVNADLGAGHPPVELTDPHQQLGLRHRDPPDRRVSDSTGDERRRP